MIKKSVLNMVLIILICAGFTSATNFKVDSDISADSDKFFINITTGNVGIGTSSPGAGLHVNGTSIIFGGTDFADYVFLNFLNTVGGASLGIPLSAGQGLATATAGDVLIGPKDGGDILFGNLAGSGTTTYMIIKNDSKVGIGTSSPGGQLQINAPDDSDYPAISIRQDNSVTYGWDFSLDTDVDGKLFLNAVEADTPTNLVTFDQANKRVGIGTSSPQEKFEVAFTTNGATLRIREPDTSSIELVARKHNTLSGQPGRNLIFTTKSSEGESMRIDSSGKVGIGTSPSTLFHIKDGTLTLESANAQLNFIDTGGGNNWLLQTLSNADFGITETGGAGEVIRFKAGGNVGIGTSSPAASALLELNSTTGALLLTRMTTAQRDALTAVNGMVLYNSEDNRIEAYRDDYWMELIPSSYKFIADSLTYSIDEGKPGKFTDNNTIGLAAAEDYIVGIIETIASDNSTATLRMDGFVTVQYSGPAPQVGGYGTKLLADGNGNVKVDATNGKVFYVSAVNTTASTVTFHLDQLG